jgi:uncharacterized membrane protein YfcA
MDVAGYIASVFIGIALGLIGGGGSILTVPVLVYLFSIDATLATTYSLFVVGITSLAGSASYFKKGLVDMKTAIVFGIPSIATVFLTRNYILPFIPAQVAQLGEFIISRNILLMLLFAILMIAASYSMIRNRVQVKNNIIQKENHPFHILLQGLFTGFITGIIGAGGGFLIIPALVNFLNMPMKQAVGASLLIISINSLAGFLFSINKAIIQWNFLLGITGIAILGIILGSHLSNKINSNKLKPAFGWFVLAMGIYIVAKETIMS